MSINGEQESNETSSLSNFLAASDDKDISGIQNVIATHVVRNVYLGRGNQVDETLPRSKWHQKLPNVASTIITIFVCMSFVSALCIFRMYMIRNKAELMSSRSVKPLIIKDTIEISYEDAELRSQANPTLMRCSTSDL
jgi:hypothetical protein